MRKSWSHTPGAGRVLVTALAAAALILLPVALAPAAWAHGDEGSVPARQDVLEAVAYIVNTPENMDAIGDKLKDALESADTAGVDLDLVQQAQTAVEANQMPHARDLLERSIGARVDVTGTDVRPILHVPSGGHAVSLATGEEAGTQVVTDELPGRGALTGTDVVLVVVAALAALLGGWLAVRFRPAHPVRQLRRKAGGAGVKP